MNPWKLSTLTLAGALAFVLAGPTAIPEAGAEAQPHMRAALATLRTAESQLVKATHDKGGHRIAALAATRQAIAQVEKGIAYDNQR
ncbi:MAG: hypothetical protein KC731_00830 [Myxococcales bacterium]|nr:hypothetical protein [Myxococcales bacterium]